MTWFLPLVVNKRELYRPVVVDPCMNFIESDIGWTLVERYLTAFNFIFHSFFIVK